MSEEEVRRKPNVEEEPKPRKRKKQIKIPRRTPSVVIPPREIVYITPGETTCRECTCFPYEEPYRKIKKLNRCLRTPLTLYELSQNIVDSLTMPAAFWWTVEDVADWMANVVGFPQYADCMRVNYINGLRLLLLEDPSRMPPMNIHYHTHIQKITASVRELYGIEFIYFTRSVGLPPRYPWTHVLYYKSRTGPPEGRRVNTTPCGVLRMMQVLMPEPRIISHWDYVWYIPPYVPTVKIAHVPWIPTRRWGKKFEPTQEYTVPRSYRLMPYLREDQQYIWKEHRPGSLVKLPIKSKIPAIPPKIRRPTTGNLMLDRRRNPKTKFYG